MYLVDIAGQTVWCWKRFAQAKEGENLTAHRDVDRARRETLAG